MHHDREKIMHCHYSKINIRQNENNMINASRQRKKNGSDCIDMTFM